MLEGGKRLTPKQLKFAQLYVKLGDASAAYRGAYNAKNMKTETIRVKAAELLKHGNVSVHIDEMNARSTEKAELSKAWVLERLMRNVRIAMGEETVRLKVYSKIAGGIIEMDAHDRDAGAANRALELLGKELKMFTDRSEVVGKITWEDIIRDSYKSAPMRIAATN